MHLQLHFLSSSLIIKEKLGLSSIVCVYDQAIFAKDIEIQFKEKKNSNYCTDDGRISYNDVVIRNYWYSF